MSNYEHNSQELGRIHEENNQKKWFCHFTGFLEGILASGHFELEEAEPLIEECRGFVKRIAYGDANDIVEDFDIDRVGFRYIEDMAAYRVSVIDKNCEKSSMNCFYGFLRGISADGRILFPEATSILEWLEGNPRLKNYYGVQEVYNSCRDAVADGKIDPDEESEIALFIATIVGDSYGDTGIAQPFGVACFEEHQIKDIESEFIDRSVVLTGEFNERPRLNFAKKLEKLGATITNNLSRRTDFLVVGGTASRDWLEQNRGHKLQKAQSMYEDLGKPLIVSEMQVTSLLSRRY